MLEDQTEPTLRKALAIGANEAFEMQHLLMDFLCQTISRSNQNGGYDVVIAGKESLDYTEEWFQE
jgi:electron transfer flavoprotein beta subunit